MYVQLRDMVLYGVDSLCRVFEECRTFSGCLVNMVSAFSSIPTLIVLFLQILDPASLQLDCKEASVVSS